MRAVIKPALSYASRPDRAFFVPVSTDAERRRPKYHPLNAPCESVSNALQRVLTAVIGIPLVIGIMYAGGWWFGILVAAAAVLAQHEFYQLARRTGARPYVIAGLLAGAAVVLTWFAGLFVIVAGATFVGVVLALPFTLEREQPILDVSVTIAGIVYPSLLLGAAVALRNAEGIDVGNVEAFWLTLTVVLMVWASDTFAYFTGRSFGKRPLAPKVSPKKTWEGTLGGAAGSLLVGIVLAATVVDMLSGFDIVMLAVICGGLSQVGDLAESRLKRSVGAKDSGTVLPGHGGLLDRLDALIIAMPLAYLYLVFAGRIWMR